MWQNPPLCSYRIGVKSHHSWRLPKTEQLPVSQRLPVQVFADADCRRAAAQPRGVNAAALVCFTNTSIAGTYLLINGCNAGRSFSADPAASSLSERASFAASSEHFNGLPALLEHLELSVLLSTHQTGREVSIGSHQGLLRISNLFFRVQFSISPEMQAYPCRAGAAAGLATGLISTNRYSGASAGK